MLILVMMLVMGLAAGVWGFMMCVLPARWDKLTGSIGVANRWTEGDPMRLHPLMRFGNRVAGLAIFVVGCWFAYVAASRIYLVLAGHATTRMAQVGGSISSSPTPALNALSLLIIAVGVFMAVFPGKAVVVFQCFWPVGRTVKPSAAPRVMLFVRLAGVFFAFLAVMSLIG